LPRSPGRAKIRRLVSAIQASGLTIYDSLQSTLDLFVDDAALEQMLDLSLRGLLLDQPLRTRSKILKTAVCRALGYPVPESFRKTQPRFPGQNFDTYVQKLNNLQIWNEEVSPSRRYVLIRVDENNKVTKVRVVTGPIIAALDPTGTLTHKYQARSKLPVTRSALISPEDTDHVRDRLIRTDSPAWSGFVPIQKLYRSLQKLLGTTLMDPGRDQERGRGALLHDAVCKLLKGPSWKDNGQFPDIREQLLEVKLQTSRTVDLGLVSPDSAGPIANLPEFRHCDVRYAVFYATATAGTVRLDHLILTTGSDFFTAFTRFGGLVKNKKLQIPLPRDFFT
jgi:hypothetical protein